MVDEVEFDIMDEDDSCRAEDDLLSAFSSYDPRREAAKKAGRKRSIYQILMCSGKKHKASAGREE
jgi:hypothetical protein